MRLAFVEALHEVAMRSPRYQVLADDLIEQITSGVLPVGGRVPTEFDLCAEHDMSRGTVRQALRCLEDLGMIARSPTGTIVIAARPVDAYHPSAGTPDEIMDLARRTKLLHPTATDVVVDDVLARRLEVEVGSHWYVLTGPLVLRGDPTVTLCWSEHYHSTVEGMQRFRRGDYTAKRLERSTFEQVIAAEPMPDAPAAALATTPGSAALTVRRVHFDSTGKIVTISIHTHRGDRYRIAATFRPGGVTSE
jgi:GntR family transcriptional regulator